MIITVIHGAMHKGITYSMTKAVLDKLGNDNEIHEFFMPADAPGYCVGCYNCFLKGEEYCPDAKKVQPIVKAIEQSSLIILDSPCYCLEMSGALKNMMDHLAYRWVTHRPDGRMYSKIGLTVSSSAGAPPKSVTTQLSNLFRNQYVHTMLMRSTAAVAVKDPLLVFMKQPIVVIHKQLT